MGTVRHCSRCQKALTDAVSLEVGVGPICRSIDNHVLAVTIPADLVAAADNLAAALEYAVGYARERKAFGQAIVDFQAVGFRLADAKTKLEAARQLTLHAARQKAMGIPSLESACMAKLFASEVAEQVCTAAIQTLGGYGFLADYPVERIYRDVRVCQIYEGTSEVQKILIARALG